MRTDDERRTRLSGYPDSRFSRWWMNAAEHVDRFVGWDKVPWPLGVLILIGLRDRLRAENLFDLGTPGDLDWRKGEYLPPQQCAARTADGSWNDLDEPLMGAKDVPFGRNVPAEFRRPESDTLLAPSPRTVSRTLLTRERFLPVRSVNLLAAAWLQFEIHDWFSHGTEEREPITVTLENGDPWPERSMRVERTRRQRPGAFPNQDTHWWDGSQLYGSSAIRQAQVRDEARLKIDKDGLVPPELTDTFFTDDSTHTVKSTLWTGWATLHTLFAREHNAICDHLEQCERKLRRDPERLFQVARLVTVALMAKIHATEWTPAIIAHRTTQTAMRMNWWGISKRLRKAGRVSTSEAISGIPGSPTMHFGVPYSLTEEFVSSYRMHPMLPDHFTFRSPVDGSQRQLTLPELHAAEAIPALHDLTMPTVLYTFGTSHPGEVTLHNYPTALQNFRHDGTVRDLGTIDILRDRERGVPRYNRFREAMHKPPLRDFEQLTPNSVWREEIRAVYEGDIDQVDLMIGLFAEPRPERFAFSDTAFRVFILMATRRLKSDRFFTECYDADHYTAAGLDWIDRNSMKSVLLRHYGKDLEEILGPVDNPFEPWPSIAS